MSPHLFFHLLKFVYKEKNPIKEGRKSIAKTFIFILTYTPRNIMNLIIFMQVSTLNTKMYA